MNQLRHILLAASLLPLLAQAQTAATGSWELMSAYSNPTTLVETQGRVYFAGGGSLFAIDRDTDERLTLNRANALSDGTVTGLWADPDGNSVIVGYQSGNLDRLTDKGKVVNMPDMRDAVIPYSKGVNSVAFAPGRDRFYVATPFGIITYCGSRNEVRETLYSPLPVTEVQVAGDHLLAVSGGILYHAPLADRPLTAWSQFATFANQTEDQQWNLLRPMGADGSFTAVSMGSKYLKYCVPDYQANTLQATAAADAKGTLLQKVTRCGAAPDGSVAYSNADNLATYTPGTLQPQVSALPEALKGSASNVTPYSFARGLDKVWVGTPGGVGLYDLSVPGQETVLVTPSRPSPWGVPMVGRLDSAPSGRILGYNVIEKKFVSATDGYTTINAINADGSVTDLTPAQVTATHASNPTRKNKDNPFRLTDTYAVAEDPADPSTLYISNKWEGVYRVTDGQQTALYDNKNSSMAGFGWVMWPTDLTCDAQGNLWVITPEYGNAAIGALHMLPAASLRKDPSTVKEDWVKISFDGADGDEVYTDSRVFSLDRTNQILVMNNHWSQDLMFYNTQGTASTADDTRLLTNKYIDQDNKYLSFSHSSVALMDRRGRLWIGTDDGVFEIPDPAGISSNVVTVNHLKVPRNDGTNLADYLLSSQEITDMVESPSGQKWIGTSNAGLYLVSEAGDQILEHFTAENSLLPSNEVSSVACDPQSNRVYVGTPEGLAIYHSYGVAGADNYDDVYAYPNPVRPDYTGWITIKGLMDNSLVKIADASGNVFFQGTSDGGMLVWDGCDASGRRVRTGVYYVFASSGGDAMGSGSKGAVAKILVVN